MSKNVLIISTSPRAGSNSELLSGEFGRGAKDSGNEVEIVSLKDKDIKFCRGCFACQKTQRYGVYQIPYKIFKIKCPTEVTLKRG